MKPLDTSRLVRYRPAFEPDVSRARCRVLWLWLPVGLGALAYFSLSMAITVGLILFIIGMVLLIVSNAAELQHRHDASKDREDP